MGTHGSPNTVFELRNTLKKIIAVVMTRKIGHENVASLIGSARLDHRREPRESCRPLLEFVKLKREMRIIHMYD